MGTGPGGLPMTMDWKACDQGLQWHPMGIGYLQVVVPPAAVYNGDYFAKYEGYADTELGRQITAARVELVRKWAGDQAEVLDIGIGSGQFVSAWPEGRAYGYDVNPAGVDWLHSKGRFWNPYTARSNIRMDAFTFWDSLEHVEVPGNILKQVPRLACISMPIFRDAAHCLASKHFRPDEHFWYFTHEGLRAYMGAAGFELLEDNRMESELGREDIGTYVFVRSGFRTR